MSLGFTAFLCIAASMVAVTLRRRDTYAQYFIVLWISVLIIWQAVSRYGLAWVDLYGVSSTLSEYTAFVWVFYVTGAAVNAMLLCFLAKYPDTGYKLIGIPVFFYMVLSILVPLEAYMFDTTAARWLYDSAAGPINSLELILLAVDTYAIRRASKQYFIRYLVHTDLGSLGSTRIRID